MLHHLSLAVSDLTRASVFYDAVLAPLGYVRAWTATDAIGYGPPGENDRFAIKAQLGPVAAPGPGTHLAFAAPSHEAVARFYAAALAHGGRDNGAPALCPEYGPDYYAAFVFDPDGHRLEAVLNRPA